MIISTCTGYICSTCSKTCSSQFEASKLLSNVSVCDVAAQASMCTVDRFFSISDGALCTMAASDVPTAFSVPGLYDFFLTLLIIITASGVRYNDTELDLQTVCFLSHLDYFLGTITYVAKWFKFMDWGQSHKWRKGWPRGNTTSVWKKYLS